VFRVLSFSMRYGILSDIHSNLPALEAVVKDAQNERLDEYVCLGDVVGYGAQPNECVEAVRSLAKVTIAGNHDRAAVEKTDTDNFNVVAKEAVLWTRDHLRDSSRTFLENLNLVYEDDNLVITHGSLHSPERFIYLTDDFEAKNTFALMTRPVCFVGHTHIAGAFVQSGKMIEMFKFRDIRIDDGKQYIINSGSVGQPRDRDPRAAYTIFDSRRKTVQIKRIPYNIAEAQKQILEAGLPEFLAQRLNAGR
jgi:predicted phosphodiesterase